MRLIVAAMFFVSLLSGCANGFYRIDPEEYRQKVQTLGVLPVLVDDASDVQHPDAARVVALLKSHSQGKEVRLIEELKGQKSYFDVRRILGDSDRLRTGLISGYRFEGKGDAIYRSYMFNAAEVAELCRRNVVDGLLVVVLNGVIRPEKRWDRMHLSYLETNYGSILAWSAVVLPSGEVVWEYPGKPAESFLPLQYPDFDEAYYNKTDEVRLKSISLAGLDRILGEPERGMFGKTVFPKAYKALFREVSAAMEPGLLDLAQKLGGKEEPVGK